jgi:hypothetical protein
VNIPKIKELKAQSLRLRIFECPRDDDSNSVGDMGRGLLTTFHPGVLRKISDGGGNFIPS